MTLLAQFQTRIIEKEKKSLTHRSFQFCTHRNGGWFHRIMYTSHSTYQQSESE